MTNNRVVRAMMLIIGIVVGLTFLFGFGNVLNLALRLGVPIWVAPLVAPSVDLSILGLLLSTRHLALPARRRRPCGQHGAADLRERSHAGSQQCGADLRGPLRTGSV
jgi:hypothetical protein